MTKIDKPHNDIFLGKLVIILSEDLQNESHTISIQDYVENGKSFIPIFSSIERFNESTKGMVSNPKIEIDGIFLLSILKGNEVLRLNPGLNDEQLYSSDSLIIEYKENILRLKSEWK